MTDGIYTTGELEAMKGASAGTVPRACLGSCRYAVDDVATGTGPGIACQWI